MKAALKNILTAVLGEKLYMSLWRATVLKRRDLRREKAIQNKNDSSIMEYKEKFDPKIFIETGTYRGDMVNRMSKRFDKIYSIELSPELHAAAIRRFASQPHIEILQGDSGAVLPELLKRVDKPALFWLDAHFSGGETTRTDIDTPIEAELRVILNHKVKNHVVLIDDAREFVGKNGYPPAASIEKMARDAGYDFDMQRDNFRIFPKK